MNIRISEDATNGKEQVIIERQAGDSDSTLENFARSLPGMRKMVHQTDAYGKVVLDRIVVTLDS